MGQQYISGEEYQAMQHNRPPRKPGNQTRLWLLLAVAAVVLVGLGALGSFLYAQSQKPEDSAMQGLSTGGGSLGSGPGSGPTTCSGSGPCMHQSGSGHPPVAGAVTAASATSITIQPTTGDAQTFSVSSSTQEVPGPNTSPKAYNASDVQIGGTVGIVAASSDSSQAEAILLDYQGATMIKN